MDDGHRLANHIARTITGPMWHGPALSELLKDVTPIDAAARPIGQAHSSWELVLHMAAWAEIARTRLSDKPTGEPTRTADWPPVTRLSAEDWKTALTHLEMSYRKLADEVTMFDGERLARIVPGRGYSVEEMLHGVIEHGTYHGGQIALLKRAIPALIGRQGR